MERARLGDESGLTLVELLVAAAMSVILVAAACAMLISAVREQPTLSKKSQEISTARYVLERMTRELRNGISVEAASTSKVEFITRVRHSTCGGSGQLSATAPSIECRVTYSCTTTACTRTETAREVLGASGTPVLLIDNLDSSQVFNYESSGEEFEEPTYVGITLHLENPEGKGELTVTDGAGLRIQSYLN